MMQQEEQTSKALWERAKTLYLTTLLSSEEKDQVERYLSMVTSVSCAENTFVIKTANSFAASFLKDHYGEKLRNSLNLIGEGTITSIEFSIDPNYQQPAVKIPLVQTHAPTSRLTPIERFASTMPLKEEYTFDEFVQGLSNSWAYHAAKGVASNPGKVGYNPLFIHGGTGLGKTHLMQAIGNELKRKNPQLAICYLTAETFLNEYVNLLKNGEIESFRKRYRSVDVLLVDDVQFLQQGKQFQTEFFNTFNALQQENKQIVMTSDVAPKNLPLLEERLISRFEGGMVQEIESPNYETRLAILKKKSEGMTPVIPDVALQFIADNIKSHVRAMEGALRKVLIFRTVEPTVELSTDIMKRILKDLIEKEQTLNNISIEEIQKSVCHKFGITIDQLLSTERTQTIVTPRQMAMYISRKFTKCSLPEIAKKFDKTHATIIHGVKNLQKRLEIEPEIADQMSEILAEFGYKLSDKIG